MSARYDGMLMAAVVLIGGFAGGASAQMTTVTTPMHRVGDSFHERIGTGFGFNLRGADRLPGDRRGRSAVVGLMPGMPGAGGVTRDLRFRQGGFAGARPVGGGYNPTTRSGLGFGVGGGMGSAFFNFAAEQGSDRMFSSEAPMVTIPNGGQGTFSNTIQRPFVTGIIPVVGGYSGLPSFSSAPTSVSPLFDRIQRLHAQPPSRRTKSARPATEQRQASSQAPTVRSSASHGDLSVAEIRRRQTEEDNAEQQEVFAWIERAKGAESAGKTSVAKQYYRMAARRAEGNLKQELLEKVKQLDSARQ